MINKNNYDHNKAQRKHIGQVLRTLRQERRLSQTDVAEFLGLSQSGLSEIELGKASLTAEQLLTCLRYFNVPVDRFVAERAEPGRAIQKALASHGAVHLFEDPNVLPSEALATVETAVRETLVAAESARSITALGPVLIRNLDYLNLSRLYSQLRDHGLDNRLGWLLDNVLKVLPLAMNQISSRRDRLALARAQNTLSDSVERISNNWHHNKPFEDYLGHQFVNSKSKSEAKAKRSEISQKWGIVSSISEQEFLSAILEAYGADSR